MASSENSVSLELRIADAPFNHEAGSVADVVFLTSDKVQFYLSTPILMLSSPVFKDMFSITRSEPGVAHQPVQVTEDSSTLDRLLRLCYPISSPDFDDLQLLGRVLEAAMKYDMEEVAKRARRHLRRFRRTDPVEVFVIACTLQLEDEARKAADAWKTHTSFKEGDGFGGTVAGSAYVPSMVRVTAGVYFRLIQHGLGTLPADAFFCHPSPAADEEPLSPVSEPEGQHLDIDVSKADVIVRTSDGTDFPVHRVVLELSSAGALLEIVDDYQKDSGLPIILVDIPDHVLVPLLELCYPLTGSWQHSDDLDLIYALLVIASKYEMSRIIFSLRKMLIALSATKPVSVYFTLVKFGWIEDAWTAAENTFIFVIQGVYHRHMEDVPADLYHSLLRYHHQRQRGVLKVIRAHVSPHLWKDMDDAELIRLLTNRSLRDLTSGQGRDALVPFLVAGVERAKEMAHHCPLESVHGHAYFSKIPPPALFDVKTYISDSRALQQKIQRELSEVQVPEGTDNEVPQRVAKGRRRGPLSASSEDSESD